METSLAAKKVVLEQWEKRAANNRQKIAEQQFQLEHERYEFDIIQRLLRKAATHEDHETWRIQADVQIMFVTEAEEEIEEAQTDLALCEAMIAEIRADLMPT